MKSVLDITVSKYNHYSGKAFDCNLLAYLNDHSLKNKVLEIRLKGTKDDRDELKARLPGITPSAICYPTRSVENVVSHTGLIAFDIDKLPVEKMESSFNTIIQMPYVAYCSLSASGTGYWGLIPISNKRKHHQHLDAIQIYFRSLGIDRPYFDTAPSSVASFRYYSFDEQAYFNHHATVFNFLYEPIVTREKPYSPKMGQNMNYSPFDDFNQNGDIQSLLIAHGWTHQSRYDRGTRKRYSRPGKTTGISADYCTEQKILFVFSSDPATGMPDSGRGYNQVQVFCLLACRNDFKLCGKKLREMGYGCR